MSASPAGKRPYVVRTNGAGWSGERLAHCSEIAVLVRSSFTDKGIGGVKPTVCRVTHFSLLNKGSFENDMGGGEAELVIRMASGFHEANCEGLGWENTLGRIVVGKPAFPIIFQPPSPRLRNRLKPQRKAKGTARLPEEPLTFATRGVTRRVGLVCQNVASVPTTKASALPS